MLAPSSSQGGLTVSIIENHRRSLPLAEHARGKRLGVTCQLKCANACTNPECNPSKNQTFQEVAQIALSRRALLGLGAAGAVAVALGAAGGPAPVSGPSAAGAGGAGSAFARPGRAGLAFEAIAPVAATVDESASKPVA